PRLDLGLHRVSVESSQLVVLADRRRRVLERVAQTETVAVVPGEPEVERTELDSPAVPEAVHGRGRVARGEIQLLIGAVAKKVELEPAAGEVIRRLGFEERLARPRVVPGDDHRIEDADVELQSRQHRRGVLDPRRKERGQYA